MDTEQVPFTHPWPVRFLRELATVEVGGTPSTVVPRFWSGDVPWMSSGDVHRRRIRDIPGRITELGLRFSNAKKIGPPAVALALAGQGKTRGTVALTEIELCTNQSVALIKGRDGLLDTIFLFHALDGRYEELRSRSAGGGRAGLSKAIIEAVPVQLPEVGEQKRIGEILDLVDVAIQQTESLIAKLKLVRAGLLQDLLTRGLDENGQLRDPMAYPEQFKNSPRGEIPKNWNVRTISFLLTDSPRNGYSPQESDEWTGTAMLGLGCLTEDGFAPSQIKSAPAGDPNLRRALLADGDLLLSRSNTRELVALPGRYRDIGVPCIHPDLMMRLVPNRETSCRFLELLLQDHKTRRQLASAARGTSGSMVKIGSHDVMHAVVLVPDPAEQGRIADVINAQDARIRTEEGYLGKLKLLKKGLMADLLTGRVRVRLVEEEKA